MMRKMEKVYKFKKEIKDEGYRLTGKKFLRQIIEFPKLEQVRETSIELLNATCISMNNLKASDTKRERYEEELIYVDKIKTNIEKFQDYFKEIGDTDLKMELNKKMKNLYAQNEEINSIYIKQDHLPRILSFERVEYQKQIDKQELKLKEDIDTAYTGCFEKVFKEQGLDLDEELLTVEVAGNNEPCTLE